MRGGKKVNPDNYLLKIIDIIRDAGGNWVSTETLTSKLGLSPYVTTYTLKTVRDVMSVFPDNYYGEFENIQFSSYKGYRYFKKKEGYTGFKSELLWYLKNREDCDFVSSDELAEYIGFSKSWVVHVMAEIKKDDINIVSKPGPKGGYLYLKDGRY